MLRCCNRSAFLPLLVCGFVLSGLLQHGFAQTVAEANGAEAAAKNVILVSIDGLRREEVFAGVDQRLFSVDGLQNKEDLEQRFVDSDPVAARQKLMPFLWTVVRKHGQILGDPAAESRATCTNGKYFSYPGYSEILCGFADSRIDSNAKKNNPNVTVLEWINQQPAFQGKVAAYTSWDVFPFIINASRSGIPVNSGWMEFDSRLGERGEQLNQLQRQWPRFFDSVRWDHLTLQGALAEMETTGPRLLYVSLGETDDWAHQGRYDLYLDAANRNDQALRKIWETAQSLPQYKDCTAMIVVTDHGRGDGREGWKSHGNDLPGSEFIWMAAMGPGIPAVGVREKVEVTQSQVAATVAQLLGLDYQASNEKVQSPLPLGK